MSRRLQYERIEEGGWAAISHPQSSLVRLPINVVHTLAAAAAAAPASIMSALLEKLRLSFSLFVS